MLRHEQRCKQVLRFKDKHIGRSCFIIGAGPSVSFIDLSSIHKHIVLSVNSSILLLPSWHEGDISDRYWISNDVLCMQWSYFWSAVLRSHCTKIVGAEWMQKNSDIQDHNFHYFCPRTSQTHPLSSDDTGLCITSSVLSAIDFSILVGCKKIFLLGVDQQMVQGRSHFWQFWPKHKQPHRLDKHRTFQPEQSHQIEVFRQNVDGFKSLKEYAFAMGAEIKNCNPLSRLAVYPRIPLEEAIVSAKS